MRQNLIIFAIGVLVLAGFGVSVIAGFNVGQAQGIAAGRHWRDHAYALEKATMAPNLTADQRARVEPVVVEAGPQITAIEADARKRNHDVIDNALAQIRPLLTQDQQKKLDDLQKARGGPPQCEGQSPRANEPLRGRGSRMQATEALLQLQFRECDCSREIE